MSEEHRLSEEWRPWCCPERRCVPVHTVQGSTQPLSNADPGESFVCFGDAPEVEFAYDGVEHVNDTRSCHYTPLKGLIAYQENAQDWQAMQSAYSRAFTALEWRRGSLDLLINERQTEAASCPTCGPTKTERHPRRDDVTRCANCKEWLGAGS